MRRSSAFCRAAPLRTHLEALIPVWKVLYPWATPKQPYFPSTAVNTISITVDGAGPPSASGVEPTGFFLGTGSSSSQSHCPPTPGLLGFSKGLGSQAVGEQVFYWRHGFATPLPRLELL